MIKQRAIALTFIVETILIGACFCFLEKILSKKKSKCLLSEYASMSYGIVILELLVSYVTEILSNSFLREFI